MKALQFDQFGSPDAIVVRDVPAPEPGPGQIRIAVRACGLTPADWAIVDGLLAEQLPSLPRGLGLEVAGTIDALGEGVSNVQVGDLVFGPATFDGPTAGAAEHAVMAFWARVPDGISVQQAAALPMAAETAWRALDDLGVQPGELLFVHGAGSTVGETAVRFALHRGVRVIATAGPTRAAALGQVGARVTSYGDGMAQRVAELAGGHIDRAMDAAPSGGRIDRPNETSPGGSSLTTLVELTGDPDRVLTLSDFAGAARLGARVTTDIRYDLMEEFARLASAGILVVPIARAYRLDQVREAARLSQSRRPGGKLMLIP
jgi:NADPH:quinone reductase-like Zn-dependent oxidoreductase